MRQTHTRHYVLALGFHGLMPCYDVTFAPANPERTFKRALIRQGGIEPGAEVLDLACGNNTLTPYCTARGKYTT